MKIIFWFLLIILIEFSYSQGVITIGDVFDFNIGDVFQYKSELSGQPPNATTKEIINKYFSVSSDTVFYEIEKKSYYTNPVWNPQPHLEYFYNLDTITEFYTDLNNTIFNINPSLNYDTLVLVYDTAFTYDTVIQYSSEFCNYLINGFTCHLRIYDVEPDTYCYMYGEGLGITNEYIVDGSPYANPSVAKRLTYFRKGNDICGSYDSTSSVPNRILDNQYSIYPNPTNDYIYVDQIYSSDNVKKQIEIYDLNNRLILFVCFDKKLILIDVKNLNSGIYILKVITDDNVILKKIIKA